MDLKMFKNGMFIKNYKEFCKMLGEPELAGNSKVAQMRRWRQYLKFTHRKQHFRIIKVYDEPVKVKDKRAGRKISRRGGEIIDVFEPIVIRMLQKNGNDGELNISRYTLYEQLGLVSNNFLSYNYVYTVFGERGIEVKNRSGFSKDYVLIGDRKIPNVQEMYFYEIVNDVVRQIYSNAFISLSKRGIASSESWREIVLCEEIYVATEEEMEYISNVEYAIAGQLGIKNPNRIFYSKSRDSFYQMRNTVTNAEEGWSGVYNILKVKLLDEDLLNGEGCEKKNVQYLGRKGVKGADNFYSLRHRLNEIVCQKVKERIKQEYTEFKENGVVKGKVGKTIKKRAFGDKDFLDIQYFLIDNLLAMQ